MNRSPMGRQLEFDLKYKMNNNDFIKFLEKEKKKVLTNQSKCGIINIENKERGNSNEYDKSLQHIKTLRQNNR